MNTVQMCRKILDYGGIDVHSDITKRAEKLASEYGEEFSKTLSEQQRSMYFNMDVLECEECSAYFSDGVLYGLQLAKSMREILDYPERAFVDYRASQKPFDEAYEAEISFLREYQKNNRAAC